MSFPALIKKARAKFNERKNGGRGIAGPLLILVLITVVFSVVELVGDPKPGSEFVEALHIVRTYDPASSDPEQFRKAIEELSEAELTNPAGLGGLKTKRWFSSSARHTVGAKLSANKPLVILRNANLQNIYLTGANLVGIDFSGANLFLADLRFANVVDSDLFGANLKWANVAGAKFCRARMPDGSMCHRDCDLSALGIGYCPFFTQGNGNNQTKATF